MNAKASSEQDDVPSTDSENVSATEGEAAPAPTARELLKRTRGCDRYILESQLAEGGMGLISAVYDQDLKRTLVMKVMRPDQIAEPQVVKEFVDEARITAQLQHPNIVPVHDIGVDDTGDAPFYTMKLVEGESLLQIIDEIEDENPEYLKRFDLFVLLGIFRKVCDAINFAHSRGIIHRDIKPENIMVGSYGEVLLLDWGIAKYAVRDSYRTVRADRNVDLARLVGADASATAAEGLVKGSLQYLSPEQALADVDNIDQQTDVFLLGATLYHIVTHQPPYLGDDTAEIVARAETASFPHPRSWPAAEQLSDTLVDIIAKAMSVRRKDRFASVSDMIQELDNYLTGRTVSTLQTHPAGTVLIKAGDVGNEMFVIVSGEVEIRQTIDKRKIVLARLQRGAIVGELAGIMQDVRTADVVTTRPTEVLTISHGMLVDELRRLPPWMEKIIVTLAERIKRMSRVSHPFMVGNAGLPVTVQLYHAFCTLNERFAGPGEVSVDYTRLARQLSAALGVTSAKVRKVLDFLLTTHLCTIDQQRRYNVVDLGELHTFIEHCRADARAGADPAVSADQLSAEQRRSFEKIRDALLQL